MNGGFPTNSLILLGLAAVAVILLAVILSKVVRGNRERNEMLSDIRGSVDQIRDQVNRPEPEDGRGPAGGGPGKPERKKQAESPLKAVYVDNRVPGMAGAPAGEQGGMPEAAAQDAGPEPEVPEIAAEAATAEAASDRPAGRTPETEEFHPDEFNDVIYWDGELERHELVPKDYRIVAVVQPETPAGFLVRVPRPMRIVCVTHPAVPAGVRIQIAHPLVPVAFVQPQTPAGTLVQVERPLVPVVVEQPETPKGILVALEPEWTVKEIGQPETPHTISVTVQPDQEAVQEAEETEMQNVPAEVPEAAASAEAEVPEVSEAPEEPAEMPETVPAASARTETVPEPEAAEAADAAAQIRRNAEDLEALFAEIEAEAKARGFIDPTVNLTAALRHENEAAEAASEEATPAEAEAPKAAEETEAPAEELPETPAAGRVLAGRVKANAGNYEEDRYSESAGKPEEDRYPGFLQKSEEDQYPGFLQKSEEDQYPEFLQKSKEDQYPEFLQKPEDSEYPEFLRADTRFAAGQGIVRQEPRTERTGRRAAAAMAGRTSAITTSAVKYDARDCATDKHGKSYTLEELREQIR